MLVAQYEASPDDLFRLDLESRRRYPEFTARIEELAGRNLHLRWDGMLVANLSRSEHDEAELTVRWQRRLGAEAELLDPRQAAELQPGVSPNVISYLWFPGEGQLDAQLLAEVLGDALSRTEIRLIHDNAAAEVLSSSGAVTGVGMADGRRLDADAVVLAAGAWCSQVGGQPRTVPVRPVRGQMLRFAARGIALDRLVASHAGRYLVPRDDGTILAGSTMEEVGFDRSITEDGMRAIHESVTELVPALGGRKPTERWAGLRPISADRLPIIGPDPDLIGLFYATGYGRDGILLSPSAGSIVADLAVGKEPEFDWSPFRPDRFDAGEN
jgi:glycine oxidase